MALVLVTAPTEEPVTVAELRTHLRLEGTDDAENSLLNGLIISARQRIEAKIRRQIITATYDLFLDVFPDNPISTWGASHAIPPDDREIGRPLRPELIELPKPPLQSITSVQFIDSNGVTQTVAAADYTVDAASEPGRLVPAPDKFWPTNGQRRLNAVFVRFVAGFGLSAVVPEGIKLAIKFLASHWYENREASTPVKLMSTPMAVDALLDPHRWGDYR